MASRRLQIALILGFLLALASSAPAATTWCVDAVNGSDSNSGAAAGSAPNYTNCKQSIEAACALLTTGDTLLADDDYYHDPTLADTALDMCAIPSSAANVTIKSYGAPLFGPDPQSDASASAILDGGDCLGLHQGPCISATTAVSTWASVSGSIWKTAEAAYPFFVYLDDIHGWPDGTGGLKAAGCIGPSACVDSVANPSQLPLWVPSHVYGANSDVQNGIYPAEWWHTVAGGTSGAFAPACLPSTTSCTAGTTTCPDGGAGCTGGGVTWVLEGPAAGTIGPMVAGSWYSDFQFVYVWAPDSANPNTHVVESAIKLYPFHVNTTTGNNGLTIQHMGMIRTGAGPLFFDTSGSDNCFANMDFEYNYISQTGESNVDVAQFLNGFRLTGSDPTCAPAMKIRHNYIAFTGDHGGGLTLQVAGGSDISYNNIQASNHGAINFTQNGTTSPCANCTVNGNYVHNQVKSQNAAVVGDSNSGIYCQYCTGLTLKNNEVTGVLDPNCGGGGQCACNLFAATTNTSVINGTCSGAQVGVGESSGFPNTNLKIVNNIFDNIVSELSTGASVAVSATSEIGTANNNIMPGTNVALVGGVAKTFAQWQAFGFDPSGQNTSAVFARTGWPFAPLVGSPGIGQADQSQGGGPNIGANPNSALSGNMNTSPLPLQTQVGTGQGY